MREQSQKRERTGYRLRRLVTGAAGIGAGAVALMMVMMPVATAGIAHPNGFANGIWTGSGSVYWSGCGTAQAKHITWMPGSGVTHWLGSSQSKTCKKSHGGAHVSSYGSASGYGTLQLPVKLTSSNTGLDVTWTVNLASSATAGTIGSTACPTTTSHYSYYYNNSWFVYNYSTGNYSYVSTWYNYTDIYSSCSASASLNAYNGAYLIDTTTGTYIYATSYPSNYGSMYNTTGKSQYNSSYWANFSNPAAGSNYSYTYGYSSASSWTVGTLGPAVSETWDFNATFTTGDKYMLTAYADIYASSSDSGYAHGFAKAMINGKTLGHGEALSVIAV